MVSGTTRPSGETEGGSLQNVSPHPLAVPSVPQPYCCCLPLLPESVSVSPFLYSARCAMSELVVLVRFCVLPGGYPSRYSFSSDGPISICVWGVNTLVLRTHILHTFIRITRIRSHHLRGQDSKPSCGRQSFRTSTG